MDVISSEGAVEVPSTRSNPMPLAAPFVGIDVGGTGIKWTVVVDGHVVESGQVPTPRIGSTAVMEAISDVSRSAVDRPRGIGVALPGTVDRLRRETVFLPNVPGDWAGYPIAAELERRLSAPVAVINDARAFAYGELVGGAGRGTKNVLFITLGTGVGGAIALDGNILFGALDSVGEIGHFLVESDGELCGCGGRGCLETIASGTAITARVTRAVSAGLSPILSGLTDSSLFDLTPRIVAEAAAMGDLWSINAFERAGRAIGHAAASTCLLLQIDTVVIGGGLSPAFPLMATAIDLILRERTSLTGAITVRQASLGHNAGSIGAALYAASLYSSAHPGDTADERTPDS